MRGRSLLHLPIALLMAALTALGAVKTDSAPKDPGKRPSERNGYQEVSFNLAPQSENPKRYILSISDEDERNISGSFSIEQLQVLRAMMVEAAKFAVTPEGVGAKDPTTTRFMDKQEPAFVIDVQKDGAQSLLFLTLKTEIGRMTWPAGRFVRSVRREEGFFFELLSRLESALPKPAK